MASSTRARAAPRASDAAAATAIHAQALEKELAQKVRPVLQSVGCPAPAIDRAVPKLLRNWPQILEALETSILAHYDDLPPKAQISYYFLHPFGAYFPSAEQKEFVEDYAQHVSDSAWFPAFSELQLRADGVDAMPHRRDAVDVAVRESTRLVREPRQFRDAVVRLRWEASRIIPWSRTF